jgi:hypothetical protein
VLQVQNIKKKFLVLSLASGEARVGGLIVTADQSIGLPTIATNVNTKVRLTWRKVNKAHPKQ